ncbi:MAG: delta-60 repeat domain-containing protein [Aquabacterium sp.]
MRLRSTLRAALLAANLMQAFGSGGTPPPAAAGRFQVLVATDKAVVVQGGTTTLRARVVRAADFDGPVMLELTGLPAGVRAAPVHVPAGVSETSLALTADAAAPHSLPTVGAVVGAMVGAGPAAPQRSASALAVTVAGAPGTLDASFAGGAQLTPVGAGEDYAHAVAVQADGKVLVAGSSAGGGGTGLAVVRYLRDGRLDTAFGSNGRVVLMVGARQDVAQAIAVQADGRILLAGHSLQRQADHDFLLVRLLADGRPDPAFGQRGHVLTDFGGDSDRASAVLVLPDGRIVAGGQSNVNRATTGVDFALARYHPDGRLDPSFGAGGKVVAPILPGSTGDRVRALALQAVDGQQRLLAVGGEGDFTIARFNAAGALDAGFGQGGKVTGLFGVSIGAAAAVAVRPGGEVVVAGHAGHDFAAVQLLPDGRLDTRFGPTADGRFRQAVSAANWDEATALALQTDGALLLGGWAYAGTSTAGDVAVLRLSHDGRLDTAFGQAGVAIHAVAGAKADFGRALALQPDDRIPAVRAIVAGEAQDRNRDFAVLRLWL